MSSGGGSDPTAVSELHSITDSLIETVLGAPRTMSREEVAQAAGMSLEDARQYWRAMGFADVGDSDAFTARDLEALEAVHRLVAAGVLDKSEALDVVRSLGQTTSRMAEWQTGTLARLLARQGEIPDENTLRHEHVEKVAELTAALLPSLEDMLVYAWRRQLAAAIQRSVDAADEGDDDEAGQLVVGFADLVGFTRLSRQLPDDRLADLVTSFEHDSADVVAATGARLIKTLGDEVMFVADEPDSAVETAFGLHAAHGQGQDVPQLRVGMAFGEVVTRMGDVFGTTVNQASRLTALARPGATLVDDACARGLLGDPRFYLRTLRPRALRGLGAVRAWSVTPAR
ncbi:MAG: adenylate/guanylate cyclase domain-containing protein [Actinobacteria bacterium]|nr:MAG: adenylate/guanylate cyclase domain-containing protein [Actinomycetota bacterium]